MTHLDPRRHSVARPRSILLIAVAILMVRYLTNGAGPEVLAAVDLAAGSLIALLIWSYYSPQADPDAGPVWRTVRWAAPVLLSFALTTAAARIWPHAKDELIAANLWFVCLAGVFLLWHARRLWRNPKAVRLGVLALAALGVALALAPAAILRDWGTASEAHQWSTISGALLVLMFIALFVAVIAGITSAFWRSGGAGRSTHGDAA